MVSLGSARRVVTCSEDGDVSLYSWDKDDCLSSVPFTALAYVQFNIQSPISNMRLCPFDNNCSLLFTL